MNGFSLWALKEDEFTSYINAKKKEYNFAIEIDNSKINELFELIDKLKKDKKNKVEDETDEIEDQFPELTKEQVKGIIGTCIAEFDFTKTDIDQDRRLTFKEIRKFSDETKNDKLKTID